MTTSVPDRGPVLAAASFRLTVPDVAASVRAHLRGRYLRPQGLVPLAAFSFVGTLLICLTGPVPTRGFPIVFFLGLLGWMLGFVVVQYLAAPLIASRRLRREPGLRHEWRVELTDSGLRASAPNRDLFHAWVDFIAWGEDRHVLMVYRSNAVYQFVPVHATSADFLAIFRARTASLPRR